MKKGYDFISAERCINSKINNDLRALRIKLLMRGGDTDSLLSELIDCVIINLNRYLAGNNTFRGDPMEVYTSLSNINILLDLNPKLANSAINKVLKDYYDEMCGTEIFSKRSLLDVFMDYTSFILSILINAVSSADFDIVGSGGSRASLIGDIPHKPFNDDDLDPIN